MGKFVGEETDFQDPYGIWIECECGYEGALIAFGYDADLGIVICPGCGEEHQGEERGGYRDTDDDGCWD